MASRRPTHLDLWPHRALAVAALGEVGRHSHAATAVVVGLDGDFSIRWHGEWIRTGAVFIPAGVTHELACDETLTATLYLFPSSGESESLSARLGIDPRQVTTELEFESGLRNWLVEIHGGQVSRDATRAGLDLFVGDPVPRQLDPRVVRAVGRLRQRAAHKVPLSELSEVAKLSESRLMHLFKANIGVPVRRFQAWERMRILTEQVAAGDSLTMAALAAGFADSAHSSHAFRGMFGIPASRVLNSQSRLRAR